MVTCGRRGVMRQWRVAAVAAMLANGGIQYTEHSKCKYSNAIIRDVENVTV